MGKKRLFLVLLSLIAGTSLLAIITGYIIEFSSRWKWKAEPKEKATGAKSERELVARNLSLKKKLQGFYPRGFYIVIDTASNVLYLKKGEEIVRRAVVSCGSGSILEEPGGRRVWIFDTPRGEFFVKSKIRDPDWIRPDWAFIEEGKEIPRRFEERVESGVLGDYALGFGDSYFIHGTLYTRLLGRNVTHGCVRVGDEDLEFVYKTVPLGTKIFIF